VKKAVRAAVADFRMGSERPLNFIVGVVMRKTRGKADACEVHRLVGVEKG
jgi:Asp-tRNA(Asn)/Glu-tRNA(Gln) amidotransferase B subunit